MSSGNRWWPRVNYDPERKGSSEPFTFQQNIYIDGAKKGSASPGQVDLATAPAAQTSPVTSQPATVVVPAASFSVRHPVLQAVLASIIASVIFSTAWAVVNVLFFPRYTPLVIPAGATNTAHPSLMALELERVPNKSALLEVVGNSPAQLVAPFWNDLGPATASEHYIFGNAQRPEAYYYPVARPTWEYNFAQLAPYTALKLFEIRVSPKLTLKEMDNHLHNWAQNCAVETSSIIYWSSWRPKHLKSYWVRASEKYNLLLKKPVPRVNECRPGGTCFVIAFDCNAAAREDFRSVEDDGSND